MDFCNACYDGHIDIVKLLIEKGANDLNWGLYNACYNGHIDIVKLLIEKGADDLNLGLSNACYNNQIEIIALLLNYTDDTSYIQEHHITDLLNYGVLPSKFPQYYNYIKELEAKRIDKCNVLQSTIIPYDVIKRIISKFIKYE